MPLRLAYFLSTLVMFSATSSINAQGFPPTPVIVASVVEQQVQTDLTLVGTVRPRRTSIVGSEVEGKVITRYKEAGQTIAAGEILFRLSNDAIQAAHTEALADVSLQETNFKRDTELVRQQAVAEQSLHDTRYQLERARAKAHNLETQMADMLIRAPFKGHIVQTFTERGQWVGRGGDIARIISIDTVRVYIDVPEKHVSQLKIGAPAQVFIQALSIVPFEGRIVAHIAEGHAEARSFPVIVEVANPENHIRSNMSAQVRFALPQKGDQVLVHKDAVVNSAMGQMVYLAQDDKAVGRPVKAGQAHQGYIAIEGELKAGDLVIVRGNERLRDGQAIRVIRKLQ